MKNRTLGAVFALAAVAVLVSLPAAAQVKSYKDIAYPKLPEFKIEKPTVYTLKNGMTVFLLEDHELPLIDVRARIRTGSLWEPADKTGLAGLVGTVERSGGTAKMSGDAMDDYLANRAASVETGIGDDAGSASMNCLRDQFDEVFAVFADVLRNPAFPQDKLDLAKVQENTGIARRNDNVMGILFREFPRLVYGKDSPMARMVEYSTIDAVTREDLVAWHKKYYVPNNVYLGIVGDFKTDEMKKKIQAAFGDWAKGTAAALEPPAYRKTPNPGVWFIEKSDVNQAYVAMGHVGIDMKNPDYFAVQVMNEVLGGGFSSRMFSNVRSKKGLAYNVFGTLGADFAYPGVLRAGLQTKSSTMAQGVDAVKAELVGIIDNPPDAAELKRAKDSILNSFVFNYDSKAKILNQQMAYAFYGLPADFLEQYRANIEKVTGEDVARVAKKYVHPDQLSILVIGKAADFDKPVSSLGKSETLDITIPPPADKGPKVAKSAATAGAGRKLLDAVVAALGGKDAAKTKAVRTKSKMNLNMGGQSMAIDTDLLTVYPDRMRSVQSTPMGEVVTVVAGNEGFGSRGGQTQDLPANVIETVQKRNLRDPRYLVRFASDPGIEANAAGEETVDGVKCQILSLAWKGTESRLWIAPDGKVVKQVYQGEHPFTRAPGQIETDYADYRAVEGRQVPFKQVLKVDGQEVMSITVDSVAFDPPVDEQLFKKPAA